VCHGRKILVVLCLVVLGCLQYRDFCYDGPGPDGVKVRDHRFQHSGSGRELKGGNGTSERLRIAPSLSALRGGDAGLGIQYRAGCFDEIGREVPVLAPPVHAVHACRWRGQAGWPILGEGYDADAPSIGCWLFPTTLLAQIHRPAVPCLPAVFELPVVTHVTRPPNEGACVSGLWFSALLAITPAGGSGRFAPGGGRKLSLQSGKSLWHSQGGVGSRGGSEPQLTPLPSPG